MKKRILILYATYGTGHKSVAEYIKKYFESNGEYECMTLDLISYSLPILGKFTKKSSELIMTKISFAWSLLYYAFDNKLSAYISSNISPNMFKNKELVELIESFNPDITIATHFYGTDIICKYNKKGITDSKIVTVVTDYKAHDFWLNKSKNIDAIIVSSLEERLHLLKYGFKNKQIFTTGIPILPEIINDKDKKQLKVAEKLYNDLTKKGIEVVLDNRNERPGVKFKDMDLLGIPMRITVGKKAAEGIVEYKVRKTGEMCELSPEDAIAKVLKAVK